MLKDKKILLCISGGIAAYKSLSLLRLLVKAGATVQVVCTKNALEFITPLSLESFSKRRVYSDVLARVNEYSPEHISYAQWADLMLVAPATANIMAKFAHGIADDALSTLYLAFQKPLMIAPAMNTAMYEHSATIENMKTLKDRGHIFIEPTEGNLACGDQGKGRMEEPEAIFQQIITFFSQGEQALLWEGKRVLITAGPTYEPIDPVRFIGNRSEGKMGFAIAEAFAQKGAKVTLISGPSACRANHPAIEIKKVETASQMAAFCKQYWSQSDVAVMTAAVADYTVEEPASRKIKKTDASQVVLNLVPTEDILRNLGKTKKQGQILIGFALETDHAQENARKKLADKNADFIVLNTLEDKGAGFGYDTNKVYFITADGTEEMSLKSKKEVAEDIVNKAATFIPDLV